MSGLAIFTAIFGLLLIASLEHTPTTIPFPKIRPIDIRLKLLTLGIGYFGIFFGYANLTLSRNLNRPLSTGWVFSVVTVLCSACLLFSGEPFKLAFWLSIMAGLNSVIFCFAMRLTEPPLRQVTRWLCRALLMLSPLMGLVGLLKGGLSPAGLLVPSYWIGETLQLEFLTYPFTPAVMVGICFHLFVVMCLVGLVYQSKA